MDVKKIREALERGLNKSIRKERVDAMEPVTVTRWWRMWALDLEANVNEALAELDNPAASDAREVINTIFKAWADIKGVDDALMTHMAATIIESFAVNRERKAREETARKCAEAFRYWMLRGQAGGANRLEAAIMEAANE